MKTIITILFYIFAVSPAWAQSISFDYTGINASNYGSADHPEWMLTKNHIPIGGPSNDGGWAEQFNISALTNISAIDVNAVVFASGNPMSFKTAPTTFNYEIFSSQLNPNNLLAISNLVSFPDPSMTSATASSVEYSGVIVPIDAQLSPGTYWLAAIGNGVAVVNTNQQYIDPPIGSMPIASTPEPPTWQLMIIGLVGIFFLRKEFHA